MTKLIAVLALLFTTTTSIAQEFTLDIQSILPIKEGVQADKVSPSGGTIVFTDSTITVYGKRKAFRSKIVSATKVKKSTLHKDFKRGDIYEVTSRNLKYYVIKKMAKSGTLDEVIFWFHEEEAIKYYGILHK